MKGHISKLCAALLVLLACSAIAADCRWTAWIPSVSSGCACHEDGICLKRCTTTKETRRCSGAGHAPHSQEQNYHVSCTGSCE